MPTLPLRFFSLLLFSSTLVLGREADVVIYGGSPAGLIAAVAAAREKASVVVVEPTKHLGGMVTGGLTSTDVGNPATIGGLALEFFDRCGKYYPTLPKWYGEPHIYQEVFATMVREAGVEVVTGQRLKSITKEGARITGFTTEDGTAYTGKVFVDATYEGDLMARAGVSYIVGRESRETYGEALAGFRPEKVREFSHEVMTQGCPCVGGNGPHYVHGAPKKIDALENGQPVSGVVRSSAAPGSADRLTQSYNFRICVTQQPKNLVAWPKPLNYDARRYTLLLRLIEAYPGIPFSRIVHLGKVANGKYDLNAQGLFSTDYVGGNIDYPDGDYATRDRIWQDHLDYVQGLFWFLAHDERVPAKLRAETASWGLCKDEFTDNANWPYHLYVREARRMIGETVVVQKDLQRAITKPDSVGMGSFIIDSHIVQRLVDTDGTVIDEGAFDAPARPYQLPYTCLTPKRAECENLLVPVCLSASHIAYCSIRMEPIYMAMGHASGLAAVMALRGKQPVQAIDVAALRTQLKAQKQVFELNGLGAIVEASQLPGIVVDDEDATFTGNWVASTYGGGGVEGSARNDAHADLGRKSARYEFKVPTAGTYEVRLSYVPAPNRASNAPVSIVHADGTAEVKVNQRATPTLNQFFTSVGRYRFTPEKPVVITLGNAGADGYVVADAVQLLPEK